MNDSVKESPVIQLLEWLESAGLSAGWAMLVIGVCAFIILALVARQIRKYHATKTQRNLAQVRRFFDLTPTEHDNVMAEIPELMHHLFPEGELYRQDFYIKEAYQGQFKGLDLHVIHAKFSSAANIASFQLLEKMFVVISGYEKSLPQLHLMPGGSVVKFFEKDNIVPLPKSQFARKNMVVGLECERIRELLNDQIRSELRDNRNLAFQTDTHVAVFYPHDLKVTPKRPREFVQTCINIATALR